MSPLHALPPRLGSVFIHTPIGVLCIVGLLEKGQRRLSPIPQQTNKSVDDTQNEMIPP